MISLNSLNVGESEYSGRRGGHVLLIREQVATVALMPAAAPARCRVATRQQGTAFSSVWRAGDLYTLEEQSKIFSQTCIHNNGKEYAVYVAVKSGPLLSFCLITRPNVSGF